MADFVRVGQRFINADKIIEVKMCEFDDVRQADLFMAAPEGDVANEDGTGSVSAYLIRFRGNEAFALFRWLDQNSVNITSESEEARAFAEYRANGGPMLYSEWLCLWKRHKQFIDSFRISPHEAELRL